MADDPKRDEALMPASFELLPDDLSSVIDDEDEPQARELIAPEDMLPDVVDDGSAWLFRRKRKRQKQREFLKHYAGIGIITPASQAAGISRRVVDQWVVKDRAFAEAFDRARQIGTDRLEAECRRRAVEGTPEPVFYQGVEVGRVMKYSDLLLLALLNAYRPEKFKNRQEHTGKDGGPIAVVHVSYDANMKPDDM